MKILVPDAEDCIIMAMRSNDRWYLLADKDERGRATLYLNISGVESPIMSSADIRRRGLTLTEDQTLGFFGALIREAFRYLESHPDALDLVSIEGRLVASYLDKEVD